MQWAMATRVETEAPKQQRTQRRKVPRASAIGDAKGPGTSPPSAAAGQRTPTGVAGRNAAIGDLSFR
jgi:hypothetical protein